MRRIQRGTAKFKRWYALTLSVIAFGVLWCVGAVVFWRAEQRSQEMTYFQALYFCYVSLLTIGYGDLAPKSNAGRPFFVVWSLIAVPTMTILISDMGDTVISNFKQGTFKLADFTVLPRAGIWREGLEKMPWLLNWLQKKNQARAMQKRLEQGFPVGPEEEDDMPIRSPTIEALADEVSDTKQNVQDLARKLALSIRRTANDLKQERPKRYSYAEWVEFTRLIRFTSKNLGEKIVDDDEEGLIEWDWIGENSPMVAAQSESEFVLDRLCESMARYIRWQEMVDKTVDQGKAAHLELDEKIGADLKMASEKEAQLASALVRDEAKLLEELEALQKQNEEL
ncbi:Potassium channel, partial [Cryomyces antarcticus]